MRLSTAVALILSALSFVTNSEARVTPKEVVVKMPKFTYDLVVGKKITFELQENLATGFSWAISANKSKVTALVSQERIKSTIPGHPDIIKFTFETKQRGTSRIAFELRRPWEKEVMCPASNFFVFVQVK